MSRFCSRSVLAVLFALALLAAAGGVAAAEEGAEPVTFVNETGEEHYLLVVHGGEKKCEEKGSEEEFSLAPGEEKAIDTGGERACWCSSTYGQVGGCGGYWNKARPGSREAVR